MSTPCKSYEAWKESLEQAEADGQDIWSEELSEASGPEISRQGAVDFAGLGSIMLVGGGLLLVSAVLLLLNLGHLTRGQRTIGMVIGHKDFFGGRSSTFRAPVVRYSPPGGVQDVVGSLSVPRSNYPIGKEVTVLYLRDNPGSAVIFDFLQLFLIPTVLGGVGLVLVSGTAGIMIWTVRKELRIRKAAAARRTFEVADGQAADDAAGQDDVQAAGNEDEEAAGNEEEESAYNAGEPTEQREDHAIAHR